MTKTPAARDPARNVWLQLGFPDAEEHYLKAELVLRLDKAIRSMGLTQRVAARRIGTTQPELSKILGGKFTEVSLERLMRFLTALGYHIEIKIGVGKASKAGEVTIKDARRNAAWRRRIATARLQHANAASATGGTQPRRRPLSHVRLAWRHATLMGTR